MSAAFGIVASALQLGAESVLIKPKRAIGPFTAYVTIKEQHQDELQITDHPLEKGAMITDHAFLRPAEVTIECSWSNSPSTPGLIDGVVGGLRSTVTGIQSALSGNSASQVKDIYDKLLALQGGAVPFDVFTGKRKYTSMLIRALSVVTDKTTENALAVTVICRQVFIVDTRTLSVSAPMTDQATPEATAPTVNSGTRQLVPGTNYRGGVY